MTKLTHRTKVFLGETRKHELLAEMRCLKWGRIFTTRPSKLYPEEPWILDSGVYALWKKGLSLDQSAWFTRRDKFITRMGEPNFIVLPDIVAGGNLSLELSLTYIQLPEPKMLVVQDNMDISLVDITLATYDIAGIFLGGTDQFKQTAPMWKKLCEKHLVPFHYGRAGTPKKLEHALDVGADSLDSSFPLWTAERFDAFVNLWLKGGGHV